MKKTVRFSIVVAFALLTASPSFAVNKDMVQLQTQIQQLQDALARLQQSNDERMGVLRDLVQQTADSVNKMSTGMTDLQKRLQTAEDAQGTKTDQVSGQIQAMNDSIDEIKARMARLDTALQAIQSQQQSINANIQNLTPPASATPTGTAPFTPSTAAVLPPPLPSVKTSPLAAPSVDILYKNALGDYMAAKYTVSASEFDDVIKAYPGNTLSGNAYFYLGEIDYRDAKYASAAKYYDKVLEQYPDNNKAPAAHLHKGEALIAMKQTDAGVRELRSLIQRFPNSPESMQARSKLSALGIPVKPRT